MLIKHRLMQFWITSSLTVCSLWVMAIMYTGWWLELASYNLHKNEIWKIVGKNVFVTHIRKLFGPQMFQTYTPLRVRFSDTVHVSASEQIVTRCILGQRKLDFNVIFLAGDWIDFSIIKLNRLEVIFKCADHRFTYNICAACNWYTL